MVIILGLVDPEDEGSSFETLRTTHLTWHHIPEDLQMQQHCQVLKSHTVLLLYSYTLSAISFTVTLLRVTMPTTIFFHTSPQPNRVQPKNFGPSIKNMAIKLVD